MPALPLSSREITFCDARRGTIALTGMNVLIRSASVSRVATSRITTPASADFTDTTLPAIASTASTA